MNKNKIHVTIKAVLAALMLPPITAHAQDTSRNFVRTAVMLDAEGTDSLLSVQYYDGLGRPTLSVSTVGTMGQTACTLVTYDGAGREKRKYLPIPGNGLDFISESNIQAASYGYYHDNGGFTENHYDALGRVTAVDLAGDAWRQAGRRDWTEHLANTPDDEVLHYEAPEDGSYSLTLPENTSFQYYPAGSLGKTVSRDADSVCVTVFTNLLGKKVLERTAAGDTYYVYNDRGQLRFVLTPAFGKISRSKAMFAYEYRYDDRGRVVKKILPGDASDGVTVQYWYDKADRTAYMKDPALGGRYRFYLYDRLGRLCVQGTCINRFSQHGSMLAAATYANGSGGLCGTGYTAPYAIRLPQIEIVNYYDNYTFTSNNSLSNIMPSVNISTDQQRYAVGSLTGQVVYTSGGHALGTVSVYDRKGRVVRSVRKGLGGRTEDVSTAYSFTGAVDTVRAVVAVGYGINFIATTTYSYAKGRKARMAVSVSHGHQMQSRQVEYSYDALGRLADKERQLTGTGSSRCRYAYDLHGWPTDITNGEFREQLLYADGLDGGCWNGNVSTVKWRSGNANIDVGYNLTYDGSNRLCRALFGTGDNLMGNRGYFSESAEYDCNGNVTRLRRSGLTDNLHGGFRLVDDLHMTYEGNMLTSVCDSASHMTYANATDFNGVRGREYPITYDGAGALVSDAGRRMARVDYDLMGNPLRIQFTDGSVTRYIYSATGEKLRVFHLTAVPNITVAMGQTRELVPSEILSADSTDYLLGGTLTMRDGRIDRYLFDEGYCQAMPSAINASQDYFTFYYFDRDHLGSVRQVILANGTNKGTLVQKMDYYPSGLRFCDGNSDGDVQPVRFSGKELDRMHGLGTYDFGARQYNPVTMRWDRMDPMCEKYYSISPYAYCGGDPVNKIDPDGRDEWEINSNGQTVRTIKTKEHDAFFMVDDDKKRIDGKSITFEYGTIKSSFKSHDIDGKPYDVYTMKGDDNSTQLFEFLADNTSVEWSQMRFGLEGKRGLNVLTTSHSENREFGSIDMLNKQYSYGYYMREDIHSHPHNTPIPSGFGEEYEGTGDMEYARQLQGIYPHVKLKIYTPKTKRYINYDKDSTINDFNN